MTGLSLLAVAATALSLTNRFVTLDFDASGRIASLRERGTGRELVEKPVDFVVARPEKGRSLVPESFSVGGDGSLVWTFPGDAGSVRFSVSPFDGGWTFSCVGFSGRGVRLLECLRLKPVPRKWIGRLSHMWSDESSGVAVRAYDSRVEMPYSEDLLYVSVDSAGGLVGWQAGLSAGPRSDMRDMLKGMTFAAGVPFSTAGGAWSLDSQAVRESCLMAYLKGDSVDAWIDLALRGGFGLVHLEGWWKQLGHYRMSDYFFPGGIDEMRKTAAAIRAAGLKVGMHTLTGCISTADPWIKSEQVAHMQSVRSYTLARNFAPEDSELFVEERPADDHDTVFTYIGRGNALRIGREIVQYTGVRRERPYAFTGVTRGAFGTPKSGTVSPGTMVDYLRQRYLAFYPEPESPLADELADAIASVFNSCGMDEIYFDGAEGMGARRAVNEMRAKIFSRLEAKGGILNETSSMDAWHWWFYSRTGAWDYSLWAPKAFHDAHIKKVKDSRDAELLGCQTGWWRIREADAQARGHFLDESEYYACKNAANDAAMTIAGLNVNKPVVALPFQIERHLTVIGWWERFRRAHAFPAAVLERLAEPGADFRLRQDGDGRWTVCSAPVFSHRVGDEHDAAWKVVAAEPSPAELRVEALYCAEPYDSEKATSLFDIGHLAAAERTAASGVRVEAAADDGVHGKVVRLSAENGNGSSRGAWACVSRRIPAPYASAGQAIGFWVKGDGSGALLNVQLGVPREYTPAFAENYVKLDFTGWRYVERPLRERDAEEFFRHVWPYGSGIYTICRYDFKTNRLATVSLYLNDVPARSRTDVEVSEVRSLPIAADTLEGASVSVGGTRVPVPFPLASGEYAEFAGGGWTKYAENGNPVAFERISSAPSLATGANDVSFSARSVRGRAARAQVSVSAVGSPFYRWEGSDGAGVAGMPAEEAMLPVFYAPASGFSAMPDLRVRPGETARLKIVLIGPVKDPVLMVGEGLSAKKIALPSLSAGERRTVLPEERFSGVRRMSFASSDDKAASARVCISKIYRQ